MSDRDGTNREARRRRPRPIAFEPLEGRPLLSAAPLTNSATQPAAVAAPTQSAPVAAPTNPRAQPLGLHRHYATPHDVQNIGKGYTNLALSSKSRSVAWEYFKAGLGGDVTKIQAMNKSPAVKHVGQAFTKAGNTPTIRRIGRTFTHWGTSISHQWNHLFRHHEVPKKPHA